MECGPSGNGGKPVRVLYGKFQPTPGQFRGFGAGSGPQISLRAPPYTVTGYVTPSINTSTRRTVSEGSSKYAYPLNTTLPLSSAPGAGNSMAPFGRRPEPGLTVKVTGAVSLNPARVFVPRTRSTWVPDVKPSVLRSRLVWKPTSGQPRTLCWEQKSGRATWGKIVARSALSI